MNILTLETYWKTNVLKTSLINTKFFKIVHFKKV